MTTRTLMVMAGGTGGHVLPGVAVADVLRAEGWDIVWLGTRKGMEARLLPGKDYKVEWISVAGLRGNGLVRMAVTPFMLLRAFAQSVAAILRHRPDVVLGMGGYTAFPGGMMASLLHKPLVIHEQNSLAGLTNRILACLADRVLVGFPQAFQGKRDKPLPCGKAETSWLGNPVRAVIAAVQPPQQRFAGRSGPLRILVVGGSLGATALNEAVPQALAMFSAEQRPQVIHQAGYRHIESLRGHYAASGVEGDLRDFIDNMAELYDWCDVVICRAGALTLAEIAAAGVASILVPYPHAVDDHQTANAAFLQQAGAAEIVQQKDLTPAGLAQLLQAMTREKLLAMAQQARAQGKPEATLAVVQVIRELANAA